MPSESQLRARERAATRYVVNENGCFVSTYSTGSHGYAQVGWYDDDHKLHVGLAHRLSWEHINGEIQEETLDHTCFEPRCVNVRHLIETPNAVNCTRRRDRGAERVYA